MNLARTAVVEVAVSARQSAHLERLHVKKFLFWSHAIAIAAIGVAAANAQAQRGPATPQMRGDGPPPEARSFSITRADPALDQIISPDAKLVELAHGFGLTEAGLWIADGQSGYWIFAGLLDNVLYKVTPQKQVSVFMEKAGYIGNDADHVGTQTRAGRNHVLLIGPSCTGMDHEGRVIWCADDDRQVMRLEKDGTHTVLSSGMNGQKFSGPNGIALSPDGKWMYLSTSGRQMRRYAVNPDGTLGAFTVFTEGVGIGDGQKTDKAGNLFSSSGAGPGIIRMTSPDGKLLGTINLPIYGGEPKKQICATNEAFGGPDGKTLFIAGCDAVFTIQLKTVGIVPAYNVNK